MATNKKNTKKKDYFEIIFISISIFMFLLLIASIYWLKNSLYEAKDQVASEFIQDYQDNLIVEGADPFVAIKNPQSLMGLMQPIDNDNDPSLGDKEAKVKIFYFSDFSCPFCLDQEEVIINIYDRFNKDVRIIWKDYPDLLSLDSFSYRAARAARCANEQGRFWDYNKSLYQEESNFLRIREQLFIDIAEGLKLNIEKFSACLSDTIVDQAILNNVSEAEDLGIVGIPYIYINDKDILGGIDEKELERLIVTELNK